MPPSAAQGRAVEDAYPLTPLQEGILFHSLSSPGTGTYVSQAVLTVAGADVDRLERAWQAVVDRHPALRTAFAWQNLERPLQVVGREARLAIAREDWRGAGGPEQAARLERWLRADLARGFTLSRAPLMRLSALRLDEERHALVWTFHHILLDGWSVALVLAEALASDEALRTGRGLDPARPRPFKDYVDWLARQDRARAETWWRERLRGMAAPTPLAIAGEGDPGAEILHGTAQRRLPADLTERLQAGARAGQVTLNTLVQGAWAVALGGWTGERDVLYGTTVSGRPADLPGAEGMVGLFINTLPTRVRVPGDAALGPWLRELQAEQAAMRAFEYSALVDVQGWSEIPRGTPLFDTLIAFENYPVSALAAAAAPGGGLRILESRFTDNSNYPLTLAVRPDRQLLLRFGYDARRFDRATVERLLGHLERVLAGVAEAPARRVADLSLLGPDEERRLLCDWNDTARPYPRDRTIGRTFREQAARTPDAVAAVCGEARLTYRELDRRSNQLARRLRALGVGPESRVGVALERSLALPLALLGVLKAGGAYVPLDPGYPAERLAFMAADARIGVVVTEQRLRAALPAGTARILALDTEEAALAAESAEPLDDGVGPDHLAYVTYTSGSTGVPKGVEVRHRGVLRLLFGVDYATLGPDEAFLQLAPVSFDASTLEVWGALLHGGRCVLHPEAVPTAAELGRVIERHGVTSLWLTASLFNAVIDEQAEALRPLRQLLIGGEALSVPHVRRALAALPSTRIVNGYGPTESTTFTCCHEIPRALGDDARSVPIGRPIGNTTVYVLDAAQRPVPQGAAGELFIGGDGLARGYLGRPDLTAERFVPDPFASEPGARLYRTGDRVRHRKDGTLDFLGRIDHQVKVRGFRIEPGEIESALARHPGVREAAVVVREDRPGDKRLVAYVVGDAAAAELAAHLQERLPPYMVPSAFVALPELPLGATGKLDRAALPAPEAVTAASEAKALRTPIEEAVAGIWERLLEQRGIGPEDDFFALGGHSLLATRVVSQVRKTFGVELPLRELFDAPTVRGLAARIEAARRGAAPAIPALRAAARPADIPLSFAQQRLWFLDRLGEGSAYHVPLVLRLRGELQDRALEAALSALAARHESLRTRFAAGDGRGVQVVEPAAAPALAREDLRERPDAEREPELQRRVREEVGRPFDLERAPLARAALFRVADDQHVLALTLHHIVADGWSLGVLTRELGELYAAALRGEEARLPPLPVQYPDYALWQRSWLDGDGLAEPLAFWRRRLAGVSPLQLPTDRPRPAVGSFEAACEAVTWPPELARGLRALAQREGATLFMVLLAAFQTLLGRRSAQDDVAVGTPVANRTRGETEGLIGFFVNTLVLRADLSGDPSFRALLRQVKETCLGAYDHQDVPFEKLVDELSPERDLGRNPLFQVLFALQNAPAARWELPGVRVEPFGLLAPPTRFDLELHLFEQRDGGLSAVMTYPTQLFERESVLRMLAQYRRLLDGIAAEPDRAIRALPLLEPWEEKRLLVEWNATGRDYPREATLVTLFEAQARRTPDAPAVARGGESLTFRELEARAEALARALRAKGVGPEVRVGVCAERTLDLVVALLGTLKAGGAYVPLDPAYPPERVSLMLADARVGALLTQERLLPGLPPCEAPVVCLDRDWPQIAAAADAPGRAAAPDDLAYVIYTSGSTGKPKGVAIAHRSAAALLHWAQELFPAEDRRALLASTSVCFDLSVFELFLPLCFGGTVHLADNALAIASEPPGPLTLINTVPSAIAELLRQRAVPPSVRTVVLAGEPLSTRLVDELYALGHVARVFDCYGPSEDTTYSTWALREASAPPTIGRPIANTRAYVLDASLRPVPIGVRGELFLGGEGLARGYLGRPELTAERFVPDPFGPAPGGRLYRTGDVVRYRPDGQLEFFGRQDHQVKLRGFRIELGEIEAALAGHPTVKDSVVVVREEASGAKRLVAYVTARDGPALDADALRAHLQAKLPAYMVPTALVELGALPLSPNGKIDRRALPAPEAAEAAEAYEAPRTPAEQALARIWADVLRVPVVGATDNFFARGGDSILSLQVVARANQAGLRVTVKQLFQRQTVRELAAVAGQVEETDAEQGTVTGAVPLTPAQRWHLDRDPLDPHHFNQSALLELRRPIGAAAVEAAAGALDAHHDALRLRFRRTPDGWQQAAAELDGPRPFARVDLGALPESAQDAAVAQAAAEAQASLDLERGPVWRAVLFDLGPARPARLLLVVHHLAVDGVSWRILLEDLESACAQAEAGQPVRLPRKTTSFKRWAERLRDWAQAGGADHERAYWDGVAAGAASLPLDHPDGKNTVGAMRVVSTVFGEDQTRALLRDVPAANRTQPLEAMLAALGEALGSWTGAPEVRVDVEAHGREDLFPGVDLSRTVGWFTSIHPLRLRRGGEGIGAALAAVKEELRGVPRGGVGYGVLRYLRGHQALGPGSAVVFNYLGRFEALADPRGLFGFAAGSTGANRSERSARAHLLEVNAVIAGGRLRVDWLYAGDVHERATVERVAARFEHALGEVVEHCRRGAWSYTPSDFPLARVRAADLARITAGARDVEDVYPLGPMQEGMLFHTLSAPESGTYSVQARFELAGALDAGVFRQAWEQVAQRHPVLRTRFLWEGLDRPLQVVRRGVEIGWEVHDWSARPEAEQDRCFAELAAADRARGFALDRAPLMRLHLVRLAERRHRLVWSFHHALLDGWSVALVLGEALALARAQARGEKPALDAPVPYRDYVAWLPSQDMAAAERYWRQELSGFEEPTSLGLEPPAALPRSPEEAVGERVFTLPAEAGAALRAAGRRHGLTLSTLVQGAWAWLLSRYSGQRDVVFGVTVSGRPPSLPGVERMVGLFINTLPLRAAVAPGRETAAWLQELQDRQVEQRQHETSPLARVQRWSGVEGRSLFESVLVFENYPVDPALAAAADGLRVRSLGVREATNYPLTVVAAWSGDRLALRLLYDRARVSDQAAARMETHLARALGGMAPALAGRVGDLPLASDEERRTLLVARNATAAPYPGDSTIAEVFAGVAARRGDATAVSRGGERLSYATLEARANQLARHLRALGVGVEHRVGVCLERSLDLAVALLGILKAGAAYVPLDPGYPAERLAFMVADARVEVVLTEARLAGTVAAGHVVCLDRDADAIARHAAGALASGAGPDDLAYVTYTSGSTGRPKGVEVTHRGVLRLVFGVDYARFGPEEAFLQLAPVAFDASTLEIWGALLHGGRSVVFPSRLASARELGRVIAEQAVTAMWLTASLFNAVVDEEPEALRPLRQLLIGGEALSVKHVRRALGALPDTRIVNGYGPTESTTFTCCHEIPRDLPPDAASVPIGRPIGNTRVYVLDGELGLAPDGAVGELFIGGDGLARGYLGRPELTAERFVPDPFAEEPGRRLYATGDRVRWRADGTLDFLGRRDHQVKVRGHRIELGEIEAALARRSEVKDVVAIVREDAPGDQRVVAYVTPQPGAALDGAALRDALRRDLPEYMVPSAVAVLEALPLGSTGKVDRRALPAPDAREASPPARVAPVTDVERTIAAIWRDVLGLDQVGADENFFDLGGHSLTLLRVHGKLRQAFPDATVTVVELFEHPTIRALAGRLGAGAAEPAEAGPPAATPAARPAGEAVAIVAMAGRFPGAGDVDELWRNLRDGVESITFFTDEELRQAGVPDALLADPRYVKARGVIEGADLFDAAFFGYTPREAELIDPQQRVFLETAAAALERAGYDGESYRGRVGVYAGTGYNSYLPQIDPARLASAGGLSALLASDKDYLTTRVSYKLHLRGPSVDVQSACSTSLVAVHLACRSLLGGECDLALAGGVSVCAPQTVGYLYQEEGILSPDGHCRAFDRAARGTVAGNGVGVVVLKRLSDALRDGDTIEAVIKGSAINNDGGLKVGYTAPGVAGQAEVIAAAQAAAGVAPETIGYVEAHGTGTSLGDPIEVQALTQAFGALPPGSCAIGSVKTNLGHLDAAAGVTGLIKAVLALRHGQIPPTLHFEQPNPHIAFEGTPFRVAARLTDWPRAAAPRRAAVSSFGLGGTNAHVILEEAPETEAPAAANGRAQVLVLSARSGRGLDAASRALAAHLGAAPESGLGDVAYTLQVGRRAFRHRRAVVCRDLESARRALSEGEGPLVLEGEVERGGREVAFLFPGQGAQHAGMGARLHGTEPVFRDALDEAAERLRGALGLDLREALYPREGDEGAAARRLEQTAVAQPALFAVEHALARLWMSWGVRPSAMLGHSVGELTAACLAGVFTFEDALALVAERGRLMQAQPRGAMLAVALGEEPLRGRLEGPLALAAVNGPSQCVVSGPRAAIEALEAALAADGVDCHRLRTSHAFHSPMMAPAVEAFRERVAAVRRERPRVPFVSNVTGTWITEAEAVDPAYWAKHLRETVRFGAGLEELARAGRVLVEVGPGQTLAGLVRRTGNGLASAVVVSSCPHARESRGDDDALLEAVARVWVAGVDVDWAAHHGAGSRRRVPLPTYPFERERYWIAGRSAPAAAAPPPASIAKKADVAEWFYRPTWRSLPPRVDPPAVEPGASWVLFEDECGLAARLRRRLLAAGARVVSVGAGAGFAQVGADAYMVRPAEAEDHEALLRELRAQGAAPRRVVHLFGVTARASSLERTQEMGFHGLIALAQALGNVEPAAGVGLTVLTTGMQEVGSEGLPYPEKATVLGAVRVIPQEYAGIACRSVDVDRPASGQWSDDEVDRLLGECLDDAGEPVAARRRGERWVQAVEPFPLARGAAAPRLRERGAYLITGGLGGIGLELARLLAGSVRARLVLLGRTALPPRAEWAGLLASAGEDDPTRRRIAAVRALEERGAEVLVLAADVSDPRQMEDALVRAESRFGRIHGVIHAAGVAGGGVVQLKTRAEAERVMAPKVRGTLVLDALLKDRRPEFVAICSSLASVQGGPGQADYAAANAFQDAYARRAAGAGGPFVVSIGWDAWREAGMAVETRAPKDLVARREAWLAAGEGILSDEGTDAFERALRQPLPHVLVSTIDLLARLSRYRAAAAGEAAPAREAAPAAAAAWAKARHRRPDLAGAYVAPRDEVEQAVADIWQELLGFEQVGVHDGFFDLGGHSLLATQVINRLRQAFQVSLRLQTLFDGPTVAELAAALVAGEEQPGQVRAIAQLLRAVESLPEDEVDRLLDAQGTAAGSAP